MTLLKKHSILISSCSFEDNQKKRLTLSLKSQYYGEEKRNKSEHYKQLVG